MENKQKNNWIKFLILFLIGVIIGSTITYFYLSDRLDSYKEDNSFLCNSVNSQTELTNKCGNLLENITGYEITQSEYLDCSSR